MRRYDLKGWESEHKRAVFTAYCTFPSPNRPSLPPSVNSYQLFRGASIVTGGAASCVSLRAKHASVFLTRFRRWAEQLDHDLKRHQFGGGFCVMSSALLNTHKKAAEFKEPYNKLMNGVFSLSSSVTMKWGARPVYHYSFHPFFCRFRPLTCGAYAYWKGGTTRGRHRWSHPPRQWADNRKWKSKLKGCIQPHLAHTKGACRRQGVHAEGRGEEGVTGWRNMSLATRVHPQLASPSLRW